ncbi:unnamed protein product, partial [Mesorhabditis spiculigera]
MWVPILQMLTVIQRGTSSSTSSSNRRPKSAPSLQKSRPCKPIDGNLLKHSPAFVYKPQMYVSFKRTSKIFAMQPAIVEQIALERPWVLSLVLMPPLVIQTVCMNWPLYTHRAAVVRFWEVKKFLPIILLQRPEDLFFETPNPPDAPHPTAANSFHEVITQEQMCYVCGLEAGTRPMGLHRVGTSCANSYYYQLRKPEGSRKHKKACPDTGFTTDALPTDPEARRLKIRLLASNSCSYCVFLAACLLQITNEFTH